MFPGFNPVGRPGGVSSGQGNQRGNQRDDRGGIDGGESSKGVANSDTPPPEGEPFKSVQANAEPSKSGGGGSSDDQPKPLPAQAWGESAAASVHHSGHPSHRGHTHSSHRSHSHADPNPSPSKQQFTELCSPGNVKFSARYGDWCCFAFQSEDLTAIIQQGGDSSIYVDGPHKNDQVQLCFFTDKGNAEDFLGKMQQSSQGKPWSKGEADTLMGRMSVARSPFGEATACAVFKYDGNGNMDSYRLIFGRSCGIPDYNSCVQGALSQMT